MAIASVPAPSPLPSLASQNQRGIALVLVGMAAFAGGDAIVKGLGGALPIGQLVAVRGVFSCLLLVPFLVRAGLPDWRALAHPRVVLRTLFEIGAAVCFLSALVRIPIASATAIIQAIPLTVTFFGALLLGEKVGWRRSTAILVGFAGVLVIVRPWSEGLEPGALLALGAVAFSTARDLATRGVPAAIPTLHIVAVTTLGVTLTGFAWMALEGTAPMAARDLGLLAIAAAGVLVGISCVAAAVRMGELAVVTPFRYSIFLWALLIGWLFFGEVPDATTLVGAAIVLASGLYTLLREARLGRDIAARSGKRGVPA